MCYNAEMKEFVKPLYFYSPRVYKYVCTLFILPHSSTIRNWISTIDCEPGFLEGVFSFLKLDSTKNNWLQDCFLVYDSMAIKKQLVWEYDKGKHAGNVEIGVCESSELAIVA